MIQITGILSPALSNYQSDPPEIKTFHTGWNCLVMKTSKHTDSVIHSGFHEVQWCRDWLLNVFLFNRIFTCPLQTENEVHRCVLDRDDTFMDYEYFTVTLYHSENSQNDSHLLDTEFVPAKSSKYILEHGAYLQYVCFYRYVKQNHYICRILSTSHFITFLSFLSQTKCPI